MICNMQIWYLLLCLLLELFSLGQCVWQYEQQFPPNSERLVLPRIVLFSIYLGKIRYPHLPLLLESMKRNPSVDFKLINIIDPTSNDAAEIIQLRATYEVPNFEVHVFSFQQFSDIINNKLHLSVTITKEWYYKMCDFKPTLAYLFPELSDRAVYKYWGYVDMDVIWGNISRFAHWFQGQYPFIHSDQHLSHGACSIYINEEWTTELFLFDPMYVKLLSNVTYYNLDEIGTQIKPENIINSGYHAIAYAQIRVAKKRGFDAHCNRGQIRRDRAFLDQVDTQAWAGPVLWQNGRLVVLHGSEDFPPRRELMFFHRPEKLLNYYPNLLKSSIEMEQVFDDMISFGYLLPSWIPLASPMMMCRLAGDNQFKPADKALRPYQPYQMNCPLYDHSNDILPAIRSRNTTTTFEQQHNNEADAKTANAVEEANGFNKKPLRSKRDKMFQKPLRRKQQQQQQQQQQQSIAIV